MKTNKPVVRPPVLTHEGGRAAPHQTPLEELRRAVATCFLFERTFYEKGSDLAQRIKTLAHQVTLSQLCDLAVEVRTEMKMRHVALFLARLTVNHPQRNYFMSRLSERAIFSVIQRADELAEFLAMYWSEGKTPIAHCVQRGLARAFEKFDEHQLAKWNRDGAVKLRDVMFIVHPRPALASGFRNKAYRAMLKQNNAEDTAAMSEREALYKRIVDGTLATPDTWETALSAGADKKATWERLIREQGLGYMALLMNLRNMSEAKVDAALVRAAIEAGAEKSRLLPMRFLSAARVAPQYAPVLSDAMVSALSKAPAVAGTTYVVVDVSGSMNDKLSDKSTLTRMDAASLLAILFAAKGEACRIFTFSNALVEVPAYPSLSIVDQIKASQPNGGTYLAKSINEIANRLPEPDRYVVITDEQSHDGVPAKPPSRLPSYLLNVASYKPALDVHQGWKRVSGYSERVVEWICREEGLTGLTDALDEE